MEEIFRGLILGLVQGLTEFFPVSSSGHLILIRSFLGWPDQGLAFDTVLHLGTLVALLWFFRKDLRWLILHIPKKDTHGMASRRFIWQCILVSFPSLLIGFLAGHAIEAYTRLPIWTIGNLAFWAFVLLAADRWNESRTRHTDLVANISWKQALIVGLAQPLAFIPGTSRSGITITAGLLCGLSREAAARFSFFLGIIATGAAGGYGGLKLIREGLTGEQGMALFLGFLAAAVSGAWAIRFLILYVSKKRLDVFVVYRLGLAIMLFFLL